MTQAAPFSQQATVDAAPSSPSRVGGGLSAPPGIRGTQRADRPPTAADAAAVAARERTAPAQRERSALERPPSHNSLEEPAKPGKASGNASSSGGTTAQPAAVTQTLADLEARMSRAERNLSTAALHLPGATSKTAQVAGGGELSAGSERRLEFLGGRVERLEHEVADLRAQVARRLDAVAQDAAASRHDAAEARNEVSTLRSEIAELVAQLLQAPSMAGARLADRSGTMVPNAVGHLDARCGTMVNSSRSDATSASSLPCSGPLSGPPTVRLDQQDQSAALDSELKQSSQQGVEAVPVQQSTVKFMPLPADAPIVAASVVGAATRPGMPSRAPARAPLPRTAIAPNPNVMVGNASSLKH